ncbi:MAG: histidine kinase, partial [Burkholderiaceae bacterium]|nr:histidine kinase [Burkholderiaceae bacterium]
MLHTDFLVREPLLDAQQRVLGYEICWSAAASSPAEQEQLLAFVAQQLLGPDGDWLLCDKALVLEAVPESEQAQALVPEAVLESEQ